MPTHTYTHTCTPTAFIRRLCTPYHCTPIRTFKSRYSRLLLRQHHMSMKYVHLILPLTPNSPPCKDGIKVAHHQVGSIPYCSPPGPAEKLGGRTNRSSESFGRNMTGCRGMGLDCVLSVECGCSSFAGRQRQVLRLLLADTNHCRGMSINHSGGAGNFFDATKNIE